MKSRLVTLIILASIFVATFGAYTPTYAAVIPVVTIPIVNAIQGQTLDIPVTVDTQGVGIRGYAINLNFDPAVIQINSVTDQGFLGDCPGGTVYVGNVIIDNVAGKMTGASATYLGCTTKTVSTTAGSPANLIKLNVTVLATAVNGKMNWVFAANSKLIDATAKNLLPPAITLTPNWLRVGPGPNLAMSIAFTRHGQGGTFDTTVTVTNNGGSISDPDSLTLSLTNTTPAATTTCPIAALDVNATATCAINGAVLSAGTNSSVATASLATFGASKVATYKNIFYIYLSSLSIP